MDVKIWGVFNSAYPSNANCGKEKKKLRKSTQPQFKFPCPLPPLLLPYSIRILRLYCTTNLPSKRNNQNPHHTIGFEMDAWSRVCGGSLLVLFLLSAALTEAALIGGWKPIEDLNDPHVREIGDFAVSEYNKQANALLKLQKVVKGETQVVSGVNYRLVLAVKEGGSAKKYEAIVLEKAWLQFKNLTSFKPVH